MGVGAIGVPEYSHAASQSVVTGAQPEALTRKVHRHGSGGAGRINHDALAPEVVQIRKLRGGECWINIHYVVKSRAWHVLGARAAGIDCGAVADGRDADAGVLER